MHDTTLALTTDVEQVYPDRAPYNVEVDVDKEIRSLPEFNQALRAGEVVVQSFNHAWLRDILRRG